MSATVAVRVAVGTEAVLVAGGVTAVVAGVLVGEFVAVRVEVAWGAGVVVAPETDLVKVRDQTGVALLAR